MNPPAADASDLPGSIFSRSFGARATDYEKYRPSYSAEVVAAALAGVPDGPVLDLGAGTGKLTAAVSAVRDQVIALEPDEGMLEVLRERLPQVTVLDGSAEDIPLADGSVAAIVVGQAFHWFPRPDADEEMARVLRPGGTVSLLWNFPDRGVEWVPKMYSATREPQAPWSYEYQQLDRQLFTTAEESWFPTEHRIDGPDGLIHLAHTWSWVSTRSESDRDAIDARLRILINQYPQLQGDSIAIPQQTKLVRQTRR